MCGGFLQALRGARRPACRRCARRCGSRRRRGRATSARRGCRRAAPRGWRGCRSRAPSAARRRRPSSGRRGRPARGRRERGRRAPPGTRSASCPDPVGAATSVCRPARIAGQAATCASVGAANVRANQAATAGWKSCSGTGRNERRGANRSGRDGESERALERLRSDRRVRFQACAELSGHAQAGHFLAITAAPPARRRRPGCRAVPAPRRRSRSPWRARRTSRALPARPRRARPGFPSPARSP